MNNHDTLGGGPFTDERATINAEDGRTCLRRSGARYDAFISDLFTSRSIVAS